ncbi:MAG: hypothetical protein ACOYNO_13735 [Saprospiraceae bacterium]
MNRRYFYCMLLFVGCFCQRPLAQIIYFNDDNGDIYEMDMATCNSTFIANGPAFNDMAVGPNGLIYGLYSLEIWEIDPVSGSNTLIGTIPPFNFAVTGLEYGQNGMIYIIGAEVWELNPANGNIINKGSLPTDWYCIGDLVYYQGVYYAAVWIGNTGANDRLAAIDVNNPANSTPLAPLPVSFLCAGAAVHNETCPKMYWFDTPSLIDPSDVWEFDINTQTWISICAGFGFTVGGADSPNDYEFDIPCNPCATYAGTVTGTMPDFCISGPAIASHDNNDVLDVDDMLQFILFSSLADTLGSILATSNMPTFAFNPSTMQTGITYYAAAIAGNNVGGNVSLADPCLSISNAVQVIWRPLPSVQMSASPNVCQGGCATLSLQFTGTAPFELTWSTPAGTTTTTFNNITGSLEICPPAGVPLGDYTVHATALLDAFCACP